MKLEHIITEKPNVIKTYLRKIKLNNLLNDKNL